MVPIFFVSEVGVTGAGILNSIHYLRGVDDFGRGPIQSQQGLALF